MKIDVIATGSTGNAYFVSDGDTGVLLDCGIKYKEIERAMGYVGINKISGVLVSHAHCDHSLAAAKMAQNGFEIAMAEETAKQLDLSDMPNVWTVKPSKLYAFSTIAYMPFRLVHYNADDTECVNFGYLLQFYCY